MADDPRSLADRRLADALAGARAADPRPALRERLRRLRDRAPEAFDRARVHYDERVLPALAGLAGDHASAVLVSWIEYARFVGELDGPGRTLAIDAEGRATDWVAAAEAAAEAPAEAPASAGDLVLHVPDDAGVPALVALAPADPTPAQRATIALLIDGRLSL